MRSILERASALYNQIFADWLDIHFAARTLILLLLLWMLVYACAQVFQYLIAPLLVLFFYHVLFRAWNFWVIETFQEWIYIYFYSEDRDFLRNLYPRLTDRIKHNRMRLSYTHYSGIIYKGRVRKISQRLMIIALVIITLWAAAFGLYNEYAADTPTDTAGDAGPVMDNGGSAQPRGSVVTENGAIPAGLTMDPSAWPEGIQLAFVLNESGVNGSNVRERPRYANSLRLEVVKGDTVLIYLNEYVPHETEDFAFWLKVRTPSGTEGYIYSPLVDIKAD